MDETKEERIARLESTGWNMTVTGRSHVKKVTEGTYWITSVDDFWRGPGDKWYWHTETFGVGESEKIGPFPSWVDAAEDCEKQQNTSAK